MKILPLCFIACAVINLYAAKTVRYIDALKVTYNGLGNMTAGASDSGNYTYKIEITGLSSVTNTKNKITDSLVIKPTSKSANSIFIDKIFADGALNKIKVTFPPGKDGLASCVRNIEVDGYVNNITIVGGDLGAPDAHDGEVKIAGSVKQILVKGKKHKIKNTKNAEWWGGNIWADISANEGVAKIIAKCRQIRKIFVKGQKAADPRPPYSPLQQGLSKVYFQTTDPDYNYKDCSLKNITIKNGSIFDSLFSVKGDINSVKVSLENSGAGNAITNVIIRAGTDMDLSENDPPTIYPNFFATGVVTETKVVVPFTIDSAQAGETLAVHIHKSFRLPLTARKPEKHSPFTFTTAAPPSTPLFLITTGKLLTRMTLGNLSRKRYVRLDYKRLSGRLLFKYYYQSVG